MDEWTQIHYWITAYYGNKIYLCFAVAAICLVLFLSKTVREKIVFPYIVTTLIIINPLLYKYLFSKIVYWRLFWMLPLGIVIACAMVLLIKKIKSRIFKCFLFIAFVLCLVTKGTNVYVDSGMIKTQNEQKVSMYVKDVCDYILSIDEHPKCIMPNNMYTEVRQYSGNIEMMYGRNADGFINVIDDVSQRVAEELSAENPNFEYICGQAYIQKFNFIVSPDSKKIPIDILEKYGYVQAKNIDGLDIYYSDNIGERSIDGWVVTQYTPNGNSGCCYTIEDDNNNLIIIDGGYWWHEEKVKSIIRKHGNRVYAWIITSPHEGNSGAFCKVMKDGKGIQVDYIYTIKISDQQYEKYKNDATGGQNVEAVAEFRDIMETLPQVQYLKENDVVELMGLKFKILHVWNEETDIENRYQEYNGSMSFVIEGKKEKMLFLSKLTRPMEQCILNRHKDDIQADYIQVNNRGNWLFSHEFYEVSSPKAVFIDSVMGDEEREQTYEYFIGRGIQVYTYSSRANWIVLK